MPRLDGTVSKPHLVNRGAAGLDQKVGKPVDGSKASLQLAREEKVLKEGKKDRVAPSLKGLVVPIDSLTQDPENAKQHPEKSLRAIMLSLALYGQRKPIAAHKVGKLKVVMAGNGTLAAAKALGWTKIAAAIDDDLNEGELAGYGMADNRSAEHGKWDWQQVARLEKLVAASDGLMVGWTLDELEVLRTADWVKPEISDEDISTAQHLGKITVTEEEKVAIQEAIDLYHQRAGEEGKSLGEALKTICLEWKDMQGL